MSELEKYQTELKTIKKIYEWHEKENAKKPARLGRLGASIIGNQCERYLWYSFRKLFDVRFCGRMLRLFMTGHLEEERLVEELRGIGCTVEHCTKKDQLELLAFGGHFVCYPDGMILGLPDSPKTWHVAEFKTMNEKTFNKLKKVGVVKEKKEHYAQMIVGMGLANTDRAVYIAKNKNNDELYGERIKFDKDEFNKLISKAERVITAVNPLERCADRPDDFRCRFCDAADLCWRTDYICISGKTCRSCCHATPETDETAVKARWSCKRHGKDLSIKDQMSACDDHLILPGLISFANPTDSGFDWIEFENNENGLKWKHGNGEGMWTTEELMTIPASEVGTKAAQQVKEIFDGTAVAYGKKLTLIEQYPPEECELLWEGLPNNVYEDGIRISGISGPIGPMYEDKKHIAYEVGSQFLVVTYKGHNYAAIWREKK